MSIFRQVMDSCSGVDITTDSGQLVFFAALDALSQSDRDLFFEQSDMVDLVFETTRDWDAAVDIMEDLYAEAT